MCCLWFKLFWREMCFVAIYTLLCGEKLSQNLYLWRKNDKYEVWKMTHWDFWLTSVSELLKLIWAKNGTPRANMRGASGHRRGNSMSRCREFPASIQDQWSDNKTYRPIQNLQIKINSCFDKICQDAVWYYVMMSVRMSLNPQTFWVLKLIPQREVTP